MSVARFYLRKLVTNDRELDLHVKNESLDQTINVRSEDSMISFESLDAKGDSVKRVLGTEWDTVEDKRVFNLKRNILSVSASIFDPLGLVSPRTAKLKTIFQLLFSLTGVTNCHITLR